MKPVFNQVIMEINESKTGFQKVIVWWVYKDII